MEESPREPGAQFLLFLDRNLRERSFSLPKNTRSWAGTPRIPPRKKQAIQNALLSWFGKHRRKLPWREDLSPYRVWISEIMLQQTRTATVLPYFRRWMKAFPDIQTLARADLSRVLKAWEGLGYYSRARNLHRAARLIMKDRRGNVPKTLEDLLRLPGIGRYTAGAILSIAFGKDVPVVDGNVMRVLSRLFAFSGDISLSSTQHRFWELAGDLLPQRKAREFNPALMEFGARVCTPRNPACARCPLRGHCLAFQKGDPEAFPMRRRKSLRTYDVALGVLWKGDRVFIQRRPLKGFLGGLWEFPGGKRRARENLRDCLERELREEVGLGGRTGKKVLTLRHSYSMYKVRLHVYECTWSGPRPAPKAKEWKWATLEKLRDLAFPAANRRILEFLERRQLSRRPRQGSYPRHNRETAVVRRT